MLNKKVDIKNVRDNSKNFNDFVCSICSFILQDPYECDNCGTPYCKDCIEAWNQRSSVCPIKCGSTLRIKPAHRYIKKMLGELKIKCTVDECEEITSFEFLNTHLKECSFYEVKCDFEDCKEVVKRKDLNSHKETCKEKEITCNNCFEKIKLCFINSNNEENNSINYNKNNDNNNEEILAIKSHNCIFVLSNKIKNLTMENQNLQKSFKICENEILYLKEKTNQLMSNFSYKCDNAHLLTFKANHACTCDCCGLIKICTRWECETCKKNYCLDCIKLLNHTFCPNSHTFTYGNNGNFMCDTCGAKKTNGGPYSLHDPVCDFDLCDNCVLKLFPNLNLHNNNISDRLSL